MRIVMLLARSTGGIGTHVADLTRALRRLGHDVRIATDVLTATTFGWEDAHLVWPADPPGVPRAVRELRALVRGADVVHAHGQQAGALGAVVLRTLGRRDRPALVVSLHNAVLGGRNRQMLGAVAAQPFSRTARLVTGASSDLVDQARRWGAPWVELAPVPSPHVIALLAAPAPDLPERRAAAGRLLAGAGIDVSGPVDLVLSIARIAPQKDLPTLVAAAGTDERDSSVRRVWAVVGGGDESLAAELAAHARGLGADLHLLGAQEDPVPWLRAASVFILTSHWEARALVVQEAMAAGTPVVTRDAGGLRDLVEGIGTLLDTSDPRAWAGAVRDLLSDPGAWHTSSVTGRTRAASWEDSEQTATRWVTWYARAQSMT